MDSKIQELCNENNVKLLCFGNYNFIYNIKERIIKERIINEKKN
jgi:hypothetical protein